MTEMKETNNNSNEIQSYQQHLFTREELIRMRIILLQALFIIPRTNTMSLLFHYLSPVSVLSFTPR